MDSIVCNKIIAEHPDYKVFWRAGFEFKGAHEEYDDKLPRKQYVFEEMKSRELTFEERMKRRYNWAAQLCVEINDELKEIHINGFSINDME